MIFSTLAHAGRYAALHPLFPRAFEFIQNTDLLTLAAGRHAIVGEQLFAIAETAAVRSRAEARLECHRKYIDIQLVLEGVDEMGWKPLSECKQPAGEFDEKNDIRFFHDRPSAWIATPPGAFCIFFPEDAHAPLAGDPAARPDNRIRKVIFKVAAGVGA